MGQRVYYFVTMVAIVVLVSLQIPTFTCDVGYIVVVHIQPHKTQDFHVILVITCIILIWSQLFERWIMLSTG